MKPDDIKRAWSGRSRGGTSGYLAFVFIIKKTGVAAAYCLLAFVVIYYIPFAPKATNAIWKYSRCILKYGRLKSALFTYLNFFNLGQSLIDKVAVNSGRYNDYSFDFSEPEDVKEILNSSKGVVIIGAHFGNWEIGAPFFDKYGKEMRVVMMDFEYQNIKKIIDAQKKIDTFKVIPITADSFSYLFEIKDSLSKGYYIAIQGDRMSKSAKHHVAEFCGHKAQFPLGPFILAVRLNAPVVFYFAVKTGYKKYKFDFTLAGKSLNDKGKRKEILLIDEYVATLEKAVLEHPGQWYNYYNFWNL